MVSKDCEVMHRQSVTSSPTGDSYPYVVPMREPKNQIHIPANVVIDIVCHVMGVSREEVCGKRRYKTISRARQMVVFCLHELSGMSRSMAFREIGQKDSSACYTYRRAEILLEHDQSFRDDHLRILRLLCAPHLKVQP